MSASGAVAAVRAVKDDVSFSAEERTTIGRDAEVIRLRPSTGTPLRGRFERERVGKRQQDESTRSGDKGPAGV
jgi:hypothetical protein